MYIENEWDLAEGAVMERETRCANCNHRIADEYDVTECGECNREFCEECCQNCDGSNACGDCALEFLAAMQPEPKCECEMDGDAADATHCESCNPHSNYRIAEREYDRVVRSARAAKAPPAAAIGPKPAGRAGEKISEKKRAIA